MSLQGGYTEEIEYIIRPELMTISGKKVTETSEGRIIEYTSLHYDYKNGHEYNYCLDPKNLFDTEEETISRCQEIKDDLAKQQNTRTEYLKADNKKSYSWNTGYHMRQVKDAQKKIEYHSAKVKLCKERSKEDAS